MATAQTRMANKDHKPGDSEEAVLRALQDGKEEGGPWGLANPNLLRKKTDLSKSTVEYALRTLRVAGWIKRPAEGIYEFHEDPREDGGSHE